jgi:RecA-family ATPase
MILFEIDIPRSMSPPSKSRTSSGEQEPQILTMSNLAERRLTPPSYVVDGLITTPGAWLLVGAQKTGKTILALRLALDYHAGNSFLGEYKMLDSRSALVVEQDDPSGLASIQRIVQSYPGVTHPDSFLVVANPSFVLGDGFRQWLHKEIQAREIGLVILDSYTALRGARQSGGDVVKVESVDFGSLDALAKRTDCLFVIIHHPSKTSAALDWDQQAAGSFAIGAAVEGMIRISRYRDLAPNATERLVQIRARHTDGHDMVLKFCKETLSYEFVMDGSAAAIYPEIQMLKRHFSGRTFTPSEVTKETGMSRSAVFRLIERLVHADVLSRRGYGQYEFP